MKTLTKKNAVVMAQNWVLSEATKRSTTEVIRSVCTLIICKDKSADKAGVFLATLYSRKSTPMIRKRVHLSALC